MSTLTPLTTTQLVLVPATTTPGVLTVTSLTSTTVTFTGLMSRDDYGTTFGDTGKFLSLRRHITSPGTSQSVAEIELDSHGTQAGSYSFGFISTVTDDSSVATTAPSVTGAANNGSGLIRITAAGHGFSTGDVVAVYGVGGVTAANGSWTITAITSSTFDLQGSTFSGVYTAGGKVTNRSGLYGGFVTVIPKQSRGSLTGTAANGDDLNGFGVYNGSTNNSTATTGYLVNNNASFTGSQWYQGFSVEANVATAFMVQSTAVSAYGMDLRGAGTTPPTYGSGGIRLPNNVGVYARNAADNADIHLFRCDSFADEFEFMAVTRSTFSHFMTDGTNFDFGTSTGTKIGQGATQKIGFWNTTPVVQPSSTGTATGFTAGGGTTVTDASTFTGAVGSTAYRISDIVKHLKTMGLLAS